MGDSEDEPEVMASGGELYNSDILKQILEAKNGEPNRFQSFWEKDEQDVDEFTEEEIQNEPAKRILWAAENNMMEEVEQLLRNDPALVRSTDKDGYTPLHRAAYNDHLEMAEVADFGLIKMLQPIREECPQDDCCCRRTMCACPASIRWTAPELLARPNTRERLLPPAPGKAEAGSDEAAVKNGNAEAPSIITTACDVYSFAMVMWEIPMCHDPFEEIATEAEVLKIVKNGGRPETPPSADVMPQYKELMKFCWDQEPTHRPTFKQIATRLKDLGHQARAYQKQLLSRQRMQKLQENYVDF